MNDRIRELIKQATTIEVLSGRGFDETQYTERFDQEKFAELIVADYARKTIQGLMSDPAFAQHMDEYYEQKWSHRFD